MVYFRSWRWRRNKGFPLIEFSFIDADTILKPNEPLVKILKENSIQLKFGLKDKYVSDFYYLGPLYHLAFKHIKRIIFLDASDLLFISDIKILHEQFGKFLGENIIGLGPDLSPNYHTNLKVYRNKNPETNLGKPGKFQGFNMGVVLYDLEGMRKSRKYNKYLEVSRTKSMIEKYAFHLTLAFQDWFTEIGWESPELFYNLPCTFNVQVSMQFFKDPWKTVFHDYHYCDKPSNIKIFHKNGCGPSPEECNNPPALFSEFWPHVHFLVQVLDIESLWKILFWISKGINVFSYIRILSMEAFLKLLYWIAKGINIFP